MKELLSFLAGYLVGTLNPSYIIGRFKGVDVKKEGSGNAGGSNALITMGKAIGFICMAIDIAKAFLTIKAMQAVYPESDLIFSCTAAGVILGHIFPFYMRFRGGKGLACLGGTVLAFSPLVLLCLLAAEAVVLFATSYLCFVPITASVAFTLIYFFMTKNLAGTLILAVPTLAILAKHVQNIKRIKDGTELKISYLWKGKEEKPGDSEDGGENSGDAGL